MRLQYGPAPQWVGQAHGADELATFLRNHAGGIASAGNPLRMGLADAYRYATQVMVANMMARDAAEGIGAFIEKRTLGRPVMRHCDIDQD